MPEKSENVIEVKNLCKYFPIKAGLFGRVVGQVHAVEDVSFSIKRGTTMGLVGESGCGKTTVGKTILHLTEKTSGSVVYNGETDVVFHALSRVYTSWRIPCHSGEVLFRRLI